MSSAEIEQWLEEIGLAHYSQQVAVFCDDVGAAFVNELREEWEGLASHLGLRGNERASLERASISDVRLFGVAPSQDQYALLSELGSGVTASVYRCRREDDGDVFAAKVIDLKKWRRKPEYETIMEKINRETNILSKLRHDSIVAFHDRIQTDETLYIILELVEGCDFQSYLWKQLEHRLDESDARYVFKQLAEALKYVHSKNIIHRDLKPDNILVDEAWSVPGQTVVKISDFGHSKTIRDGYTRAASHGGAPLFEAPEVGSHGYDERVDLWSLGMILYVILSGHSPQWQGDGKKHFAFKGTRQTEELVRGLVRVNPDERLTLDQCLQSTWVTSASSTLVTPGASGNLEQPQQIRIRVTRKPKDVKKFMKRLDAFGNKHKVGTSLDILEVVATFPPYSVPEIVQRVRGELNELLFEEYPEMKKTAQSSEKDELSSITRKKELEELQDIYGKDLEVLDDLEWRIWISRDPDNALRVNLSPKYPRIEPPRPEIECSSQLRPGFSEKDLIYHQGESCIYRWVEEVSEAIVYR